MPAEPPIFTVTHSAAVLKLARALYEEMERLDPGSGGGTSWDELPELDVEYYASCVESIVRKEATLLIRAMADYDVILRHPELSEKMKRD